MKGLKTLVANASPGLSTHQPELTEQLASLAGPLHGELLEMLAQRNGFYAFEGALKVFPTHSSSKELGLADWNDNALWRHDYNGLADNCLFFAEDVFGGQFCIKDNGVYAFDPETASLEYLAAGIDDWAKVLLEDYQFLTGYPLAHQWQRQVGPIPAGKRLAPKVPFVLGGDYD